MELGAHNAKNIVEKFQSPVYVYNKSIIQSRCTELLDALKVFSIKTKACYACKANTNPHVLKTILEAGIKGIDTVSIGESQLAEQVGYKKEDILYTENYISDQELEYAITNNILLNVGELSTLEKIGRKYPGQEVAIRINPDIGSGECSKVITGGPESKFGIYYSQHKEITEILNKYNLKLVGLHQHIGSNICQKDIENYTNSVKCIFETALLFQKDLKFINIGGGIGVPYKAGDEGLNLQKAFKEVAVLYDEVYRRGAERDIELWIEPGRFLVAESGVLLSTATCVKSNPFHNYIGLDTGMNHLVRPAFYGSYHRIQNLSNFNSENKIIATVCGNICENSDLFSKDREIEQTQEGDIIGIFNAGAYCFSMANNYNMRERPCEVLIEQNSDEIKLIRRRETQQDLLSTVVGFQ